MFSTFGEITEIYIDKKNHKWAFIHMKTQAAAERALRELNGHSQLGFKLQYAKEKSDSASATPSETGSPAEMNRRKSEDTPQTGNQFIEGFKQKSNLDRNSMKERNRTDQSDMSRPNFQFSKTLFATSEKKVNSNNSYQTPVKMMNGEMDVQPVPNCLYCRCQTLETCSLCSQPFCSRDCMIRRYDGHIAQCIRAPLLTSQVSQAGMSSGQPLRGQGEMPTSQPLNNYSQTISQDFKNTSENYLNHRRPHNVSNSYKDDDVMTDYGARNEVNSMPNARDKKPTAIVNSKKTEMRKPVSNESPKNGENIQMNGRHPMKENRPDNFSSTKSTVGAEDDDAYVNFNLDKGGRRDGRVKKDRDSKSNYLNQEKVSSPRTNQTPASGRRSDHENESSYASQPRNRASKEHESTWNNQSEVSGHRSKKEHRPSVANESPPSRHSGNNTPSKDTRDTDDETVVKRRPFRNSQWDIKKNFEKIDNLNDSPRSPKSECNSTRPSKPEFSPPVRVDIKENARFQVKLAEGDDETAVMIMRENESLNSMIDTLQKFSLEPVDTFSSEMKCVARRTTDNHATWYRCVVHTVDPLSVKFIDFSQDPVKVRKEDVRKIPHEFQKINPFAYRVNFRNAAKEKLYEFKNNNTSFEVVFVSKEDKVWNVDLVEKSFNDKLTEARNIRDTRRQSVKSPEKPQNSNPAHSDLQVILKKDVPIEVCVTHIEKSSKKIFVTLIDKLKKLSGLIENAKPDSMPKLEVLRMNGMCLAYYVDSWYRARISSVDPLEVYYVDFGNIESAKKSDLKRVPEDFIMIQPLVVAIKFKNESECSVEALETIKIIPIEELTEEKVWMVRLASKPETSQKQSTVQEPKQSTVQEPAIESNESYAPKVAINDILEVQVTYPVSHSVYYVGPKDISDQLMEVSITDKDVQKMKVLEAPSVGTYCLRSYDGVWSRARIEKLDPLTIYFLDFGNTEKVQIKDLYPLPEKYHSTPPPLAFKIHLQEPKDLPEYVPIKIQKVSEKFWTVVNESSDPKINSNVS